MIRAAGKFNKRGYAEATLQNFATVEAVTAVDIHVGAVPTFSVDHVRLERAVSRYVRGLCWHGHGTRAPQGSEIIVRANPLAIAAQQMEIEGVLRLGKHRVFKDRVFWYAWVLPAECREASLWLIMLFNEFALLALVRRQATSAS